LIAIFKFGQVWPFFVLLYSSRAKADHAPLSPETMTSILLAMLWKLALPLLAIVALVFLLTESPDFKVRRLRRSGLSQRAIAAHMGITRYQVRRALA